MYHQSGHCGKWDCKFSECRLDKAGTGYTLRASGGILTDAISTSFNVTAPAPASITLGLSPTTVAADGASQVQATAIVRDSNGNPLPGETVVVNSSGDVSVGLVTDNNGTYTATITASLSPGDEIITATVGHLKRKFYLTRGSLLPWNLPYQFILQRFPGWDYRQYNVCRRDTEW